MIFHAVDSSIADGQMPSKGLCLAIPVFLRIARPTDLPFTVISPMKRTVILTLILLLCGAFYLISRAPQSSGSGVAVQYLGMTNDPALGKSALIRINNRTFQQIALDRGPAVQEKRTFGWSASALPWSWRFADGTNLFGLHDWVTLSLSPGRELVVVVPEPVPKCVWRVTFQGMKHPPKILQDINKLSGSLLKRFMKVTLL